MLFVVGGDYSNFDFPGGWWFQAIISRCGGEPSAHSVIGISHPDFQDIIASTPSRVIVCIDRPSFSRVTGIETRILLSRGYLYTQSDCCATRNKVKKVIGYYKSSKKKDGIYVYKKGDPRYGLVEVSKKTLLSSSISWIISTFSFDYVRKTGFSSGVAVKADISRALRFENPESFPLSLSNLSLTIGSTLNIPLSLDIETIGFTRSIQQIGLSSPNATVSTVWNDSAKEMTQFAINDASTIIGHNLPFDIPRLEEAGIYFAGKPRFDTMLAAAMLNPDLHKALEKTATLFLDLRPWKHLATSDLAAYNAYDSFVTYHLYLQEVASLHTVGMYDLFTKTVMPATSVLIRMTERGIRVDVDRLFKWQQELRTKLFEASTAWTSHVPDVNPMSPPQLSHYFYTTLKLTKQFTKRHVGNRIKYTLSTDESALHSIKKLHSEHSSAIDTLLTFKKLQKLLSTYATIAIGEDSCLHPSYLPSSGSELGGYAATGRLASSNPNIQNQTPDSKKLFIPHHKGWLFLEFDFSQIELRIAAALSDDKALKEALEGDVHAATMALVGCDRVRAKNLIYGSLYGAGSRKLASILKARGLETSISECEALQRALARAYPGLWSWRSAIAAEGMAQRYLTNSFSRRRYFFGGESSIPEMYDFLPQSNAADILWALLLQLDEAAESLGGHFLTTTHDSGLFEFPASTIPNAASKLKTICEQEWPQIAQGFKVPVKFKVGKNWGEMSEFEERTST